MDGRYLELFCVVSLRQFGFGVSLFLLVFHFVNRICSTSMGIFVFFTTFLKGASGLDG